MTTQARELAKLVNNSGDISLGDDITLGSDGALLNFGADSDVVITHVADTGLLLNSTRQLQFGDSGTYIHQSADGVLDLVSDTEIEINATTIDINGNADISGTLGVTGAITGNLTGTASLATASTITANNSTDETVFPVFVDGATGTQGLETDTGFTYNPSTNTLGVVNLTVSGTNTIVDSVTMNANNAVIFEGATANAHETTLTSIDATGDRTISLPNVSGTLPVLAVASATAITTTPEEINLIDGGTSRGTTAVADGDGILHNDAGTMLMTSAATFKTYFQNGVQATTSSGIAVSGTALTLKTTSSTANDRAGAGFNATESSTDSSRSAIMYLDADNGAFGTGDSGAYFYIEKKGGGGEVSFINQDNAALNFRQAGNLKFTMSGNNLHLNGGTDARIQLGTSGAGATSTSNDTVHIRGDGDSMKLMTAANGHYIFEENGTEHFRIKSGGNVGIGENDPAATLHVEHTSGTAYDGTAEILESIIVSNKNGTDDSGANNVATIGLHVADGATSQGFINYVRTGNNTGDFTFSQRQASSTYSEAFRITNAGTFGMGPGSGGLAGSIIINNDGGTGTINNAYYNTVLGWEAADDLTSGDSNTIIGNQAGYKLTSGSNNTLIGRLAGENLTTGGGNLAIGYDSLGNGTVTGSYNIALGHESLQALVGGSENVCLGRDSGHDITSASQNVAIGHESLTKNQSGAGNTAVGFQALEKVTATYNVALGYKAGEAITGGGANIAIGYQALVDTTPTTTGSINIGIGVNVRCKQGSESGSIIIGNDIEAYATNSFTFGSSSQGFVTNQFSANANWARPSDERLKQDIQSDTLGLNFINDLRTVTYRWKGNNEIPENFMGYQEENVKDTSVVMHGMIAQEVKTALDTASVSTFAGWDADDTTGQQMLSTEMFVYPLIKAVQELTAKLEAAEARITTLEG